MRILGIDPGIAIIGLGVLEAASVHDMKVLDWMTIETPAGLPLALRLKEIDTDLQEILRDVRPDLAVVERLFFATNAQTAIDVAHGRGVILQRLAAEGIEILEPTPLQMKLAITGDGQADKKQVQTMLLHLLKLKEIPKPDDAADALALAVYGALRSREAAIR